MAVYLIFLLDGERMGFGQERREEDGGKVHLIFENLDDLSHLYWDLCIH